MDKELMKEFKDGRVKVYLKSGDFYTGQILSISNDSFIFLDKFNDRVLISLDSVRLVRKFEVNKDGWEEVKFDSR